MTLLPVAFPRVIVPYSSLHPVVKQVLDKYALDIRYVQMEGLYAYHGLLKELWSKLEPFVIVEQDVLPWPGAIEELWQCSGDWCTYSYRMHGGIGIAHALGCAKLSARLMASLPNVWDEQIAWNTLDQVLFFAARNAGIEPHMHRPPVIHLSERH